ncbi:MAG: L-threonylcarbamoyladenylate synthase, partial [Ktedonobacterales bacterium]
IAVEGIFAAKERPHSDPLIAHIADPADLERVATRVPESAYGFVERFWPGPLTLIVPRAPMIPALVSAGGDTIGVRMPSHTLALELLRVAGTPVAAPSANRFMHTSPTTAAHVRADLNGRIDCIIDGGPCSVGVESTVLDVTGDPPRILRPGGVSLDELRTVDPRVLGPDAPPAPATSLMAKAPGQMERHYAPRTRLLLYDGNGRDALDVMLSVATALIAEGKRVGALVTDEEVAAFAGAGAVVEALGPADDLPAIARRLYASLRGLDERRLDVLLAHTFGDEGMGLALRDRLRRAAGGSLPPV